MARSTGTNPVSADVATTIHLVELKYWNGATENTLRLTDAVSNIDADVGAGVVTFQGTGVLFSIGKFSESTDMDEPGVDIAFDGVDQTIISVIMNNQFRGRKITVWRAFLDEATGQLEDTPILLFDGYQNSPYSIGESMTDEPDAVSVTTRGVSRLTLLGSNRPVKTNVLGHRDMLRRWSYYAGALDSTLFVTASTVEGRRVFWGKLEDGWLVDNARRAAGIAGRRPQHGWWGST